MRVIFATSARISGRERVKHRLLNSAEGRAVLVAVKRRTARAILR